MENLLKALEPNVTTNPAGDFELDGGKTVVSVVVWWGEVAMAASAHRAQVIDEAFQVALFVSTPSPCHLDHEHLPRFQ